MTRPALWTRNRVLALAGALFLLLLGLGLGLPALRRFASAERSVDARTLRFGRVTRGELRREVSVQGKVVAALHPTLFSPAQGIVELQVKPGASVRKGEVLARIQSSELVSRLEQARATLLSARSDLTRQAIATRQAALRNHQAVELLTLRLTTAQRGLDRAQRTWAEGLIDRTQFERAQDDLQIAKLELENARAAAVLEKETLAADARDRAAQVERQESVTAELQRQVDGLTVTAPFDGMVATIAVRDRDAVAANQGVLTVVDLSALEIEISIPEEYAKEAAPGNRVLVTGGGRELEAKVTSISPEVVEGQVRATVAFAGESPAGIRQNERVTTRLVFESKMDVLKAPRGPWVESGAGRKAYVVDGDLARLREVRLGAMSVAEVEVAEGLAEGETVVLSDTAAFEGARTALLRR